MDKMLVAVFDTGSAAENGISALEDLHWSGDITLYGTAVISKDSAGKVKMERQPEWVPATAIGMVAGGLLGLLAGPAAAAGGAAAGAAASAAAVGGYAGAAAGAAGGAIVDLGNYGFSTDFIDEVSKDLIPGTTALLAEVDEFGTLPVDTALGQLGGLVFRRSTSDVVEDQLAREAAEIDAEDRELEAEIAQAKAETKAALQRQRDRVRQHAETVQTKVRDNLERIKKERDAKVQRLHEQMERAKAERRADVQRRIDDVNADYERRKAKLEEARPLIKEALHR